jgi:hypothetical protein
MDPTKTGLLMICSGASAAAGTVIGAAAIDTWGMPAVPGVALLAAAGCAFAIWLGLELADRMEL